MHLTSISALLILANLTAADTAAGARDARHLIVPFIGYQILEGETVGYTFHGESFDPVSRLPIPIESSGMFTQDVKKSVIGVAYRYAPVPSFFAEAALSALHNKENHKYSVVYQLFTATRRTSVEVTRGNTLMGNIDLNYNLPLPIKWLTASLKAGGGYAWRSVSVRTERRQDSGTSIGAENMYIARAGVELTFWRNRSFLLNGTVHYTSFIPAESGLDAFGGIGWGVGFFPIWSEKRLAK